MECNADLKHFIFVGLLPKDVYVLLVTGQGLLGACGNIYIKLVGALVNTSVDGCNYPVSFLGVVGYPPSKGWYIL